MSTGDTDSQTKISLYQRIIYDRRLMIFRSLICTSIISCLITFIYIDLGFGCLLSLFQNILIPFLATYSLLSVMKSSGEKIEIKIGIKSGLYIGAIPAILSFVINNIQYYFLGKRQEGAAYLGLTMAPLTLSNVFIGLLSQVLIAFVLMTISALIGALVGMLLSRDKPSISI